jgi:hypothetical protein
MMGVLERTLRRIQAKRMAKRIMGIVVRRNFIYTSREGR